MKDDTIKKVKLNFIFGLVGQVVTLLIGIIIPRLFIVSFGSEVNGFINLMNQVFVYVALLEAGVGSASMQALYTPVAKDDKTKINQILSATHYFYNKTGVLYVIAIVVLAFVFPLCIKSNLSYILMVTLTLIAGLSGAVPYFFQAKYKLLFQVEGKNYVVSILTTLNNVLLSCGRLVLLLMGLNVVAVQSVYLILNIGISLIYIIYVKKNYKWINLKETPDMKSVSQKNSVMVHQISSLVFNNTDTIILTYFCDLSAVSIYVLYKNLIGMISTLITNTTSSMKFKLGQSFHNREYFLKLHDAYETFHVAITFCFCTVAYICLEPFIAIYTEGMDVNYVIPYFSLLMIILEILNFVRMPSNNLYIYAGHFKQTQWRSVLEAIINIVSSLIFVYFLGINGVVLGTIVALIYRTNDMIIYGNKVVLERSPLPVYRTMAVNIIISVVSVAVFRLLNIALNSYVSIILCAVIMCIVLIPAYLVINFVINKESGKHVLNMLKNKRLI